MNGLNDKLPVGLYTLTSECCDNVLCVGLYTLTSECCDNVLCVGLYTLTSAVIMYCV